jgi:hypothetical protein
MKPTPTKTYTPGWQIQTLDSLWVVLQTRKVVFANGKVQHLGWILNMRFKTVKEWIDKGRFWYAERSKK